MEKLTIQQLATLVSNKTHFETPNSNISECIGFYEQEDIIWLCFERIYSKMNPKDRIWFKSTDCTPKLHNINCLTKTITHNGEKFSPVAKLCAMLWKDYPIQNYDENYLGDLEITVINICSSLDTLPYDMALKLAEWHINFNGIPEGLYIDKNTFK